MQESPIAATCNGLPTSGVLIVRRYLRDCLPQNEAAQFVEGGSGQGNGGAGFRSRRAPFASKPPPCIAVFRWQGGPLVGAQPATKGPSWRRAADGATVAIYLAAVSARRETHELLHKLKEYV